MTKRNFKYKIDTIFWWVIYALPLVFGFIFAIGVTMGAGGAFSSVLLEGSFNIDWSEYENFGEIMGSGSGNFHGGMTYMLQEVCEYIGNNMLLGIDYFFVNFVGDMFDSPVANALREAFDLLGVGYTTAVYMDGEYLVNIMSWFIYAHIIHLFVDFIVFIPRLAHKWLGKAYQED